MFRRYDRCWNTQCQPYVVPRQPPTHCQRKLASPINRVFESRGMGRHTCAVTPSLLTKGISRCQREIETNHRMYYSIKAAHLEMVSLYRIKDSHTGSNPSGSLSRHHYRLIAASCGEGSGPGEHNTLFDPLGLATSRRVYFLFD